MTLNEVRRELDKANNELLACLLKRLNLSADVADIKLKSGTKIFCPEREAAIFESIKAQSGDMYAYTEPIFRSAIEASKQYQRDIIKNSISIALIGMPGSGKTGLGKMAAAKLKRAFFDTDVICENMSGLKSGEYILKNGEEAFRLLEARALEAAFKQPGVVVATGGGAVLRAENRELIKRSARVYHITRPLNALALAGRPLSKNLNELEKERLPIYTELCDISISNTETPEDAANKILLDFEAYIAGL